MDFLASSNRNVTRAEITKARWETKCGSPLCCLQTVVRFPYNSSWYVYVYYALSLQFFPHVTRPPFSASAFLSGNSSRLVAWKLPPVSLLHSRKKYERLARLRFLLALSVPHCTRFRHFSPHTHSVMEKKKRKGGEQRAVKIYTPVGDDYHGPGGKWLLSNVRIVSLR